MNRFGTLASLSVVLCAGTWACRSTSGDAPNRIGAQLAPLQPNAQDPLETIARYEDARTDGDGLLQALLHKGSTRTRERAAMALGRLDASIHGASVTEGLVAGLDDDVASVRAAAAFGLGQRGDAAAVPALLAHWNDPEPLVRARLVEAASRIDDGRLRAAVLAALEDADARVRAAAALGPLRFPAGAPDAALADTALSEFLLRDAQEGRPASNVEARCHALFALARRKSERARAAFVDHASGDDPRERIYSAQGLGAVGRDEESARALGKLLADPDWRVVCEAALALGKQPAATAFESLVSATQHASAHVRRCAYEALGSFATHKGEARAVFEHARVDPSPNVRAAAIAAGAKLYGDEAAPKLALAALEKDGLVRAGAATGAAELSSGLAVPMLATLAEDPDLRVAGIAIEGLGRHATAESRARLLELLTTADNGLRLAAVTSLAEFATRDDLPALHACMNTSTGEISAEIAAAVVGVAGQIGGAEALPLVKSGLTHSDPFVRQRARKLAAEKYPHLALPRTNEKAARIAAVPIPGQDAPLWTTNPRVEVATSRGALVFELFPDEAPSHVFNFLALAEKHHYDGLVFHRVVPDFVVQGGDHRGDGNGGITWRGEPLRAEFTPRPFVRGSLGMPRNEDPDSGGSQFFVTHRPTPHLDGRYTIFGELRGGFDVLDTLEVGDRIESVRLLEAH